MIDLEALHGRVTAGRAVVDGEVVLEPREVRRKRAALADDERRELDEELRGVAPPRHDLRGALVTMTMAVAGRGVVLVPSLWS